MSHKKFKELLDPRVKKIIQKFEDRREYCRIRYLARQANPKLTSGKKEFFSPAQATDWIQDHPMFWGNDLISHFQECFHWSFVLINPKTKKIDNDPKKNTKLQCEIECGPYIYRTYEFTHGSETVPAIQHDHKLDIWADTFEIAILKLAQKIYKLYGDYSVYE